MEDVDDYHDPHGVSALQPMSPDRVNQQSPVPSSVRSPTHRDSRIHDKIRQFNNLSHLPPNTPSMSKQLERMTADAALKRAMVGREEAESEMRRYRDEARALRKQVEEGRERERRVGERLETIMENYGRAKETYSHTQAIWEKEIRRARKETFKVQSSVVKLQEELKAARAATKSAEECLERERQLGKAREQEAFSSRYQLAGVQEELARAMERIKFLEDERDAFKSVLARASAGEEEEGAAARLANLLPLPPEESDSEFSGRESLSTFEIAFSAATEAELEELTRLWQWERQRADRMQEHLEFVEAEFEILSAARSKNNSRRESRRLIMSPRKEQPVPIDPSDLAILGQDSDPVDTSSSPAETPESHEEEEEVAAAETTVLTPAVIENTDEDVAEQPTERKREPRRGTIFLPAEGIFRTISQMDFEAMEKEKEESRDNDNDHDHASPSEPMSDAEEAEAEADPPHFSRTPSVEPPSFALLPQERTSLLSLLNAPRESEAPCDFMIPTTATLTTATIANGEDVSSSDHEEEMHTPVTTTSESQETGYEESPLRREEQEREHDYDEDEDEEEEEKPNPSPAGATPTPFYTVMTTTTTIPMKDDATPLHHHSAPPPLLLPTSGPSFDVNNPALTPTMTREEALAQIRERRGRARSAMLAGTTTATATATATPKRRRDPAGMGDRNVSGPSTVGNRRSGSRPPSAAANRRVVRSS
ncbi:hypothetical protein F5Y17DRAFT_181074 [Xylariaceae sp. FL0594]|nr:hypothetical protein F5Y17DRAFT_181074 [Xylariaceae sp. FL0594]